MARNSSEIERLPSWKLRLTIWHKQLRLDMKARGVIADLDCSLTRFHDEIAGVKGIPSDSKTFSNWVQKKNYPQGTNLKNLLDASKLSGRWLITERLQESLHCFLNSLDFYLCAIHPEKNPALFKRSDQVAFADQYLIDVGKKWLTPFILNDEGEGDLHSYDYAQIQDVSLSMLQTHGSSAIPLYLCSLGANDAISDEEIFEWYMDLICSTLIVIAFHHENNIDYGQPTTLVDKEQYLGTNPNLLASIGDFLLWPDSSAMHLFSEASETDFNEITDCTKLLECLLTGNVKLRSKLHEVNLEYREITDLVWSELAKTEKPERRLLPRVLKNKISASSLVCEPFEWNSADKVVYHLCSDEPTRVNKKVSTQNGYEFIKLLPCKSPIKAGDNHYSWGYGGRGVYNMAYTLLFDFINHKRVRGNLIEPNNSHIELLVYKFLSRIDMFLSYTISSEQIIYILNQPIFIPVREVDNDVTAKFISAVTTLN